METKHIMIIILLIAILVLATAITYTVFINQPHQDQIRINDITIKQDSFGIYHLDGHITPLKDFNYVEARITFYDEHGTIINKNSCAWNMLNLNKGENISIADGVGTVCSSLPSYAIVSFYDGISSDVPLANATITFDVDNSTNVTNATMSSDYSYTSSSSSSDNNDSNQNNDDKRYTQEDVDNARNQGYRDGYSDSLNDASTDSSSSSDVETTSDSSVSSVVDENGFSTAFIMFISTLLNEV